MSLEPSARLPGASYSVAIGHGNEYYALEWKVGPSVSGSLFTVSSSGLELLKQFKPNEAYAPSVSLAGQLVVSTASGLQSVHKDGSMASFCEAGSSLLESKYQASLRCFDDEGDIILARNVTGEKSFIYKLIREGCLLAELFVLEKKDIVTSLAFDPHNRRVLFTS